MVAGSQNAELAAGRRRPVEHGCILCDKLWTARIADAIFSASDFAVRFALAVSM
jgi:hypothetical protein